MEQWWNGTNGRKHDMDNYIRLNCVYGAIGGHFDGKTPREGHQGGIFLIY